MEITINYVPREWQKEFHEAMEKKRRAILVLHRRAGKTTCIVNQLQKDALITKQSLYAYVAPTYKQAKRISWDIFKKYSEKIPNIKYNENDLAIIYPNGSKIMLLGSDNAVSLKGIGLWGVALDEYAQQPPGLWSEVIMPCLTDHNGYAIFLGTPMGKGEFYKIFMRAKENIFWYSTRLTIYDTKIFSLEQIESIKKECSDEEEFNQEWMVSFDCSTKGAYYAKELFNARMNKQIGIFPYNKSLPVHTVWDIGYGDATAIGFFQKQGSQIFWIDYYENNTNGLEFYIAYLKNKDYVYGKHFGPHDISSGNFQTGKTTIEMAKELGFNFETREGKSVIPKLHIQEGINSVRNMFSRLFINEPFCQSALDMLSLYRKEWNDDKQMFNEHPVHDYTSHCADMLRYASFAETMMTDTLSTAWKSPKIVYPVYPNMGK